jgi:hypothetical protein
MGTLTPSDPAPPDDRGTIALIRALRLKALDDDVATHASALTFTAFLSLFPLILLATSVLGFRLDNRGIASIEQLVQTVPGLDGCSRTRHRRSSTSRFTAGLVGSSDSSGRVRVVEPSGTPLGIIFDERDPRSQAPRILGDRSSGSRLLTAVTATGAISAFLHTHGLSTGWLVAQVGISRSSRPSSWCATGFLCPVVSGCDLVPAALVCAVGWTALQGDATAGSSRDRLLIGPFCTGRCNGVRRAAVPRIASWIFLAGAELAATLPEQERNAPGDGSVPTGRGLGKRS